MNKDPSGKQAPAGGFQNLGWYSGYQYYNGSFAPQAGVIHPNSPQQGAGKKVSAEVNAQSAQAQGKSPQEIETYLNNQNKQYTPAPTGLGNYGKGTGGAIGGGGGSYDLGGGGSSPKLDLPALYKNLYSEKGISDIEKKISEAEQAKATAELNINDNPFLSEATRVGRIQKLNTDYENRTAGWRNELATKKADIETQLNIQTKQFDINSQSAQFELSKFNTLLQAGAFDNASGEDIAGVTRATGLSSNMINSAVQARKDSQVQTSTVSFDDGTNQGFAVINSKTGEIITKQTIAGSKPTKTSEAGANADNQVLDVQYLVTLYQNTNKKNPSWQIAHDLRSQYSPKDFYSMLVQTYPKAQSYIKSIKPILITDDF